MTLRFPAIKVASQEEFAVWFGQVRETLDQRWLYEQQEIREGYSVRRDGTCGICLQATEFISEAPAEARNWREELVCGCTHGLANRHRALLHFMMADGAVARGGKVGVFGPEDRLDGKLGEFGVEIFHMPRLAMGRLGLPDASLDQLICADYLHHVPPLSRALSEMVRVLRPGGEIYITLPFDVNAAVTMSRMLDVPQTAMETGDGMHIFGWDLLDLLRDAGLVGVAVHFYWSDEFGYLGPFNMIFSGVKA